MTTRAQTYVNIDMTDEAVARIDQTTLMDILRHHAERAIKDIPHRAYALDRGMVRCAVEPPWEVVNVQSGVAGHADPLLQRHTYRITIESRNLLALEPLEAKFAQGMANNIPEGALPPPDFVRYIRGGGGYTPQAIQSAREALERAKQAQAMLDNRIISPSRAAEVVGLSASDIIDTILKKEKP